MTYIPFAITTASTILFTLMWVHFSKQEDVKRTVIHSIRIALCLTILNAASYYLLCQVFSIPEHFYLLATAIVFLIAAVLVPDFYPDTDSDEIIVFVLIMLLVAPLYIVKQLVLGFPDRKRVILSSATNATPALESPKPKGRTGLTISALRPMGTVDFAGEQFDAASATGKMIDAGQTVHWTGHRGNILLVEELPSQNAT